MESSPKTTGIDPPEESRSLDSCRGKLAQTDPGGGEPPGGSFKCHYDFVQKCPLWCCLISSLNDMLRNSASGRKAGFRAGSRLDSNRENIKLDPAAGLRSAEWPILKLSLIESSRNPPGRPIPGPETLSHNTGQLRTARRWDIPKFPERVQTSVESLWVKLRTGRFLSPETPPQKRRLQNRAARGSGTRPETSRERPKTSKTNRNSGTLPRPKGLLYQRPYRTEIS